MGHASSHLLTGLSTREILEARIAGPSGGLVLSIHSELAQTNEFRLLLNTYNNHPPFPIYSHSLSSLHSFTDKFVHFHTDVDVLNHHLLSLDTTSAAVSIEHYG